MARQVQFTSPPLTPKPEYRNRMPAATEKRAEAILAAYELLEVARECEVLDLVQGVISARTTILAQLAEFASKPQAVNASRNLIILAKILGELDSDLISDFAVEFKAVSPQTDREEPPPTLWQLTKQANQPDVRRGLSFILQSLGALGRAVKAGSADSGTSDAHKNAKA
jgi:uncharacterized protein YjgD (DUF1641 family)